MTFTAERAKKVCYITDMEGANMVTFQFAPDSLQFEEGGNYTDITKTGNYFSDVMWISGSPKKFDLQVFVDRTQESADPTSDSINWLSNIQKLVKDKSIYLPIDVVNLGIALAKGKSSSAIANFWQKRGATSGNPIQSTAYNASPEFPKSTDPENGVISDLEKFCYFLRPKGLKLRQMTTNASGVVSILDNPSGRFVPPPKLRFYYGNIWREGYATSLSYSLTMMNKLLIPRRLEGTLSIACTNWGYLNEIKSI